MATAGEQPMATKSSATTPMHRPFTGFDSERATYERLEADLLRTAEGKFVVIVGDELVGPLETDEDAERAGYARFGLGPLFIKQVLAEEPMATVTRGIATCQT
jgi:hypothetical protein